MTRRVAEQAEGAELVVAVVEDAVATKILACVAELRGRFGAGQVADVLTGASTERLRAMRHDRLAAYGTLRHAAKHELRGWIEQMIGHGHLARSDGEYPTVILTESGRQVLRGELAPPPLRSVRTPPRRSRPGLVERGVEAPDLFEALRAVRRALAAERGVPPYVIFSDASLRDMARLRPTTPGTLLEVKGVGEWKCNEFGERFLAVIRAYPGSAASGAGTFRA